MPFPTIEQDSERRAIKHDFYNLDTLIGELSVPKEEINNEGRFQRTNPPDQPGSAHQAPGILDFDPVSPPEPIAPEIAALSGKAIAGTIDTVMSTGLSLYAKSQSAEKYEASPKQMERLSEAWAAVAAKYNYRVEDSPWFHVIALNAGIYFPKYNEAKNDRRFAEMDERFKMVEKMISEQEAKLTLLQKQNENNQASK